jgi:hypothetical protein
MIGPVVYILCAATSAFCTFLLWRRYQARRTPLLLWSGACFLLLTANNGLLFVDFVLVPNIDLSLWRVGTKLCAICLLLYGIFRSGGVR